MKATFDANFGMVRNKKVGKSFRKSFPIRTNFLSLIRAPWTEHNITELCFAPTTRCDCLPNKETFGKTILLVGWHHGPMLHGSSSFLATIGMSKNKNYTYGKLFNKRLRPLLSLIPIFSNKHYNIYYNLM